MNKHFLKILIAMLIFLLSVGAVNALESNFTSDFISAEQNDIISVCDNSSDVLTVETENNVIEISCNDSEVLAANDNNTEILTMNDNNTEVLTVENENELISTSDNSDDVLSVNIQQEDILSYSTSGYHDYDSKGNYYHAIIEYHTLYIGQLKIPKKYKKFLNGYKPSKKYKKEWKKYKAYKKYEKKLIKKAKNLGKKLKTKAKRGHWEFYGDPIIKIKYSKNYMYIKYWINVERLYRYYPSTGKRVWET